MATQDRAEERMRSYMTSVKEDLMTGVSFMIPFVTIGGIFLAIGFAIGDTEAVFEQTGTLGWYFAEIGVLGLTIMIPILGGISRTRSPTGRGSHRGSSSRTPSNRSRSSLPPAISSDSTLTARSRAFWVRSSPGCSRATSHVG